MEIQMDIHNYKDRDYKQLWIDIIEASYKKLKKNENKGNWKECHIYFLFKCFFEEVEELKEEYKKSNSDVNNIIDELADIINFAGFIIQKVKKYG